jgi:hypothetical protein
MISQPTNTITFQDGETRIFGKVAKVLADQPVLTTSGYFILFRVIDGTVITHTHIDELASDLTKLQAAHGVRDKVRTSINNEKNLTRLIRKINNCLEVINHGVFINRNMGIVAPPTLWAIAWSNTYGRLVGDYKLLTKDEIVLVKKDTLVLIERRRLRAEIAQLIKNTSNEDR